MRFFFLLLLTVSNVVRAGFWDAPKTDNERRLAEDKQANVVVETQRELMMGKGKGMMMSKGKGMMSSSKGKGKSMMSSKGKGMISSKGKGKGKGIMSSKSKGKGKGKSASKGKGKGKGKSSSMGKGKGKGKGAPAPAPKGDYKITLMNMGEDTSYDDLFANAAARWEEVIVGDVLDIPSQEETEDFDWFQGEFDMSYAGAVDDLVIGYAMSPAEFFDDESTLGFAAPIFYRSNDFERNTLPITSASGIMRFNTGLITDIGLSENDVYTIILHEMGHVLGVGAGVGWDQNCATNCLIFDEELEEGYFIDDDAYRCPKATFAFYDLGLKTFYEMGIPFKLDSEGGLGSACSHWSELSFNMTDVNSELMTPFFSEGVVNPLSTVTIGALEDLGYEVDYKAADSFPAEALVEGHRRRHLQAASPTGTGQVTDSTFDLSKLMQHPNVGQGFFHGYEVAPR